MCTLPSTLALGVSDANLVAPGRLVHGAPGQTCDVLHAEPSKLSVCTSCT